MHGVIFFELHNFVDASMPAGSWYQLLEAAGLSSHFYTPLGAYPDEELAALVTAASEKTGQPATALLESFGEFIAPELIQMYPHLIRPEWKTLDVIEHTEKVIHAVARSQAGARPPVLKATRSSPGELQLVYSSPRKLCSVAKGITRGLAKFFGEEVRIEETACMHAGAPECRISLTVA
jgi:predicted hydrocarbon binding protein